MSAAIRNMTEYLRKGRTPPVNWIAGRIQGGELVMDQAGGSTTKSQPILEDPLIDVLQIDPMLTPRPFVPGDTERWEVVPVVLQHETDAITPPTIACRVGGYRIMFFGAELALPFSPEDLAAIYGSFAGYRACVDQVVIGLERAGLYDSRIESAKESAERSRALFSR